MVTTQKTEPKKDYCKSKKECSTAEKKEFATEDKNQKDCNMKGKACDEKKKDEAPKGDKKSSLKIEPPEKVVFLWSSMNKTR